MEHRAAYSRAAETGRNGKRRGQAFLDVLRQALQIGVAEQTPEHSLTLAAIAGELTRAGKVRATMAAFDAL